jgi:hypothetical protein
MYMRNLIEIETMVDIVETINKRTEKEYPQGILVNDITSIIDDKFWGINLNFGLDSYYKPQYIKTDYTVSFRDVLYPVSYKIHLSINKTQINDHISIDLIINHSKLEKRIMDKGEIYLKFHYEPSNKYPNLKRDDFDKYGDIKFKLTPKIRLQLNRILLELKNLNVITNFSDEYEFYDSGVINQLGTLVFGQTQQEKKYYNTIKMRERLYKFIMTDHMKEKYLKYKTKYLELKKK